MRKIVGKPKWGPLENRRKSKGGTPVENKLFSDFYFLLQKKLGNYIKKLGNYIETLGNYIKTLGSYIKKLGNYIKKLGNYIKTLGNYIEKLVNNKRGSGV